MVFENGQSNSVIQIYPGLFLVAMATKFGTKWAITRLLLETYAIFAFIGRFSRMGYRMLPMKFCATFHGCHANEIWDKKGYNLASARDICEILAFIRRGAVSKMGHRILPTKFYRDRLSLPWQRNLRQKDYNSDSVKIISKIFASNGRFGETGFEWGQSNSIRTDPCCHLNATWPPNDQDRDCKISMVRCLRHWSTVGKCYFTNKTANINVQNISLYIC